MATANRRTMQLRCTACGGTLEAEEGSPVLTCPYCGAKELIIESDDVKKARIRAEARKEIEIEKLKFDEEQQDKRKEEKRISDFRHSFMRKFLIFWLIVFFIFTIVAFTTGASPLAGVVGLIQTGLVTAALLLGNGTIKTRIPNLRQVLQTIPFFLIILFLIFMGMNGGVDRNEAFFWPDSGLSSKIPVPESEYGHIYRDSSEMFDCCVYHYSSEQFNDYKKACREMGFDQEQTDYYNGWTAFDSDGDKLELSYYESGKEMDITLTAAKPMSALRWPTSTVGKLVPVPKSQVGFIEWEADYGFVIYVGETSKEEYDEYVSQCIDSGFDVNFSRNGDYFYADNEDGFHLSVNYYGNDIMVVRADQPYDWEEEASEEPSGEVTTSDEPEAEASETQEETEETGEVSEDFKTIMDDYEAFIDDYVAFMKKYENAEDTSGLSEDYKAFMDKFATIMNDLNSIDPSSLSKADYDYYQQVLTRIFIKLAALGI